MLTSHVYSIELGSGGVIRSDNAALANLKASDLLSPEIRIAIAKEEIGWEYVENNLDIKENPDRFSVSEDLHIDKLVGYVISNSVDILLVDAVTCSQLCKKHNSILIDIFRKQQLYTTECGILIPQNQESLSSWLTTECKFILKQKKFWILSIKPLATLVTLYIEQELYVKRAIQMMRNVYYLNHVFK